MSGSDDSTGREFLGVHECRSSSPDDQMSVDSQNPDMVLDGGQKTSEGSTSSLDKLSDDENEFCFENLTSFERGGVSDDDTWNEWDAAALLESKRRKVQESGKNKSISKKRKDRPNRGMSAAKDASGTFFSVSDKYGEVPCQAPIRGTNKYQQWALRTGLWSAAIGNEKVIRKKEKIAAIVAGFTIQAMDFIIWGDLKKLLPPDDYETVWQSVFTSVAKFVLSIFDVEDFKRVYNMHKINAKHKTLVRKLRNLKADNCPLAVAIAEKKLAEEDFCGLMEQDVGLVLQGCHWLREYGTWGSERTFNICPFQVDDVSEGELKLVLEEMEKFVPLKEEHKTQLSLEFLHKRSYHVLDALFVETWKGVEFEKVVQYLPPRKYNPDDPFVCGIADFVSAMQAGLFFLAIAKNSAFAHFRKAVTFPLSRDIGKFGEEVIKVVLIADHERRMQGRRFISLKHIMFGLSLSRVGEAVQKILNDRGLNEFTEKPPKMPIYFIYMLSSEAARSLGEDVVQLEHLALAIIYVKLENVTSLKNAAEKWANLAHDHLESLKKANSRNEMKSVKVDVLVNNLSKECYSGTRVKFDYSVTKLIHDFGAGLSFPTIRG